MPAKTTTVLQCLMCIQNDWWILEPRCILCTVIRSSGQVEKSKGSIEHSQTVTTSWLDDNLLFFYRRYSRATIKQSTKCNPPDPEVSGCVEFSSATHCAHWWPSNTVANPLSLSPFWRQQCQPIAVVSSMKTQAMATNETRGSQLAQSKNHKTICGQICVTSLMQWYLMLIDS